MEINRLFKVKVCGLNNPIGVNLNCSYVVATDPTSAYNKVRKWLDENDLGFKSERELESIELIADDNDLRVRLFI